MAARAAFPKIHRQILERMLRDEKKIQARVHQLGVGAGYGVSNASRGIAIHTKKSCSTSARNVGAGRRWPYGEIAAEVKIWHERERRMGHVIDKVDVLHEFTDKLEAKIQSMEIIGKTKEHSQAEAETLVQFKSRLDSLTNGTDRLSMSFTESVCEAGS